MARGYTLVWVATSIVWLDILNHIKGEICYDFDCYYTSHCDGDYDNRTGICYGKCVTGWYGPTCQLENVALGKPVYQNIPYTSNWRTGNIVDGNTSLNVCVNKGGIEGVDVFVEIDMKAVYKVKKVTIYHKKDETNSLQGFSVGMSMIQDGNITICYQHQPNEVIPQVIDIECHVSGRYLLIMNSRSLPPYPENYSLTAELELCEVLVFVCAKGTFGDQCENLCYCYDRTNCDDTTGHCPESSKGNLLAGDSDGGLSKLTVGLLGVLCGCIFSIFLAIIIIICFLRCRHRRKFKLPSTRSRDTDIHVSVYDNINDAYQSSDAFSNRAYARATEGDEIIVSRPNSGRPLPDIILDDSLPSDIIVYEKPKTKESNYIDMNKNARANTAPTPVPSQFNNPYEDISDMREKVHRENNGNFEALEEANNIREVTHNYPQSSAGAGCEYQTMKLDNVSYKNDEQMRACCKSDLPVDSEYSEYKITQKKDEALSVSVTTDNGNKDPETKTFDLRSISA